jgi:hypothetical protein
MFLTDTNIWLGILLGQELSAYLDPGGLNEVKEIVRKIRGRIAGFRKNTTQ